MTAMINALRTAYYCRNGRMSIRSIQFYKRENLQNSYYWLKSLNDRFPAKCSSAKLASQPRINYLDHLRIRLQGLFVVFRSHTTGRNLSHVLYIQNVHGNISPFSHQVSWLVIFGWNTVQRRITRMQFKVRKISFFLRLKKSRVKDRGLNSTHSWPAPSWLDSSVG